MDIAQEMLTMFNNYIDLLKKVKVVANDEYDIETKVQSSQWKSSEEQIRSNVKVLLTIFFDCNGVVHREFLP